MEYSQEQLNYFRLCYIAFDLVPAGLRQIFKNEWDFLYKATSIGEWKDTAQNGLDFFNNESKASHKKNARCLATIHNDTVGSTLSPTVLKLVDDVRQVRNAIAHITEARLTDADFQTFVDRVLKDFTSLGLSITEIQEIKNQTTFPTNEVEKIKKQVRDLQAELDQTKSTLQSTEAALVSTKEENKSLTQEISSKLQSFCILASRPPHVIIRRSHDIERIINKMEELYKSSSGAVST
ncbi:unnamed protein product, partial [Porites evermanni]